MTLRVRQNLTEKVARELMEWWEGGGMNRSFEEEAHCILALVSKDRRELVEKVRLATGLYFDTVPLDYRFNWGALDLCMQELAALAKVEEEK